MYVLAINGSPRKGGNTEIMLTHVLKPLQAAGWDTEMVRVGGKKIHGCIACDKCFENQDRRCAADNDGFNDILIKILKADALVLGSPTYFTDVSAELKAVLDRTGLVSVANGNLLCGKIGAAVVAVRRAGATHVFDTINHMFLMSRMIVPGSTYWNMGFGLGRGEVEKDDEGLRNMLHLGKAIAWLGAAIAPHRETYPVM